MRDVTAQTRSRYLGHVRLHRDLGQLRERLTLLEQRRPDLVSQVADQLEVPPAAQDLAAALQDLEDRLLERRYGRAVPVSDAIARSLGPAP
ncbi:hypothetical protein V6K52_03415 [Knoellia sp. S7-12]|uniref:hypothetical protein n=1 Tax=Knoellia sp. S7-12 TaxID=3126698 RepID=UPI0033676339